MGVVFKKITKGITLKPEASDSTAALGDIQARSDLNKVTLHNGTTPSPLVTAAHSETLTNKTVDVSANTFSNIADSNISSSAAISLSKLAALSTHDRVLVSSGSGVISESSVTTTTLGYVDATSSIQTQLNGKQASGNYITALTSDVTASGPGSAAATISSNAVTNSKMAQMATLTIKGNNTGGTADPLDLTVAQVKTMLDLSGTNSGDITLAAVGSSPSANGASLSGQQLTLQPFDSTHPGVVTASSGGTTNFLRADGSWAAPSGSGGLAWSEVTGTTQTIVASNGYIANNAAQVVFTLPATSSVGDIFEIAGKGAGGWAIYSNASASAQTIHQSNLASATSSSSAISLWASTNRYDAVRLLCTTTNSVWDIISNEGATSTNIVATGGTITTDGNYKVHSFTTSGTFQITSGQGALDVLVVAGGGGGGMRRAGGGGAGGYKYQTALPYGVGSYTVTVGGGGAGATSDSADGGNGSNSVFDTITSTGGGGGASNSSGNNGHSGGSGGGGEGAGGANSGPGTGGSASPSGQGNTGGYGFANLATDGGGGGGGGSSAAGGDINNYPAGPNNIAGNGGAGTANSITGASVTYAGGGGGGCNGGTAGTGGSGGGANGNTGGGSAAANGTANTGGGGGGGGGNNGLSGSPASSPGGNGGSGIVIVRYRFQ